MTGWREILFYLLCVQIWWHFRLAGPAPQRNCSDCLQADRINSALTQLNLFTSYLASICWETHRWRTCTWSQQGLIVSAHRASLLIWDIPAPSPPGLAGADDELFDWLFSSQLPSHNYLYNDNISITFSHTARHHLPTPEYLLSSALSLWYWEGWGKSVILLEVSP